MATPELCSVPDCGKPRFLSQLCAMHRTRMFRHKSLENPAPKSQRKTLSEILGGTTVFGALTVIGEEDGPRIPGNGAPRLLRCRCECGSEKLYPLGNVKRGLSKSCGCQMAARLSKSKTTHGDSQNAGNAPEYRTWAHMIGRCANPRDKAYPNYGGRGITVCERWIAGYENFLADMGRRPAGHSLDRIDVNGPYSPENCRWATWDVQCRNRRNNRVLKWQGRDVCLTDAAAEAGLTRTAVEGRLKLGWTVDEALARPVRTMSCRPSITDGGCRSKSAEYAAWLGMRDRCGNPRNSSFREYGARGIQVFEGWNSDFDQFLSDVGPKPSPHLSLDRIDVNGNYEPGNVRWADRSTQAKNQRRWQGPV